MVLSVVKVILVPVLLGILLRTLAGDHVDKVSDVMPLISVVAIVMIIGGIVAINAEKILSCGVLVLGVVAIHNFCGMMLGFLAAKIFHMEYSRTTAIAIEVGMQNSALLSHWQQLICSQSACNTSGRDLQCMAQYCGLHFCGDPPCRCRKPCRA